VKDKARANLKATMTLVEQDLLDPAMSRLYYALFQAGVHALEAGGKRPQDLGPYSEWKHETVCGNASLVRGRKDDRILYTQAKGLRVQADYTPTPVGKKQLETPLPKVEALLAEVCP
jgi:hypothetical protein